MQVQVLGPTRVLTAEGAEVAVGTTQQRALLTALVLCGPASLDVLVDALWPDEPPAAAESAVYGYVSRLRRVLEPDRPLRGPSSVLRSGPQGYHLDLPHAAVDVHAFTTAATEGRQLLEAGALEQAGHRLQQALDLHRGEPYADLGDRPVAQAARRRLAEQRLGVVSDLGACLLRSGEHRRAVLLLEDAVGEHPLQEGLWRDLALALSAGGRHADALGALRRARAVLREELGIDPGPELQRLELGLLRRGTGPGTHPEPDARTDPDVALPRQRSGAARGEDPAPPSGPLVGRRSERDQLRAALAGEGPAVVLVCGPAGIGKTSLLREAAALAPVPTLWGPCLDGQGVPPLWPWHEVLRQALDHDAGPVWQGVTDLDGAPELCLLLPQALEHLPQGGGACDPDPGRSRFKLAAAVARVLRAAAEHAPLAVVLEDLHWADSGTLQVLEAVAVEAQRSPLRLLVSLRDEERLLGSPLRAALASLSGSSGVERLTLTGLDLEETRHLVLQRLPGADPQVVSRLHQRSGGNPLFAVGLRGLLRPGTPPEEQLDDLAALPERVRDVIGQRLDLLPARVHALLAPACLAGRAVELNLVAPASGLDGLELDEAVDEAVLHQVLEPLPDRLTGYRFSHELVREAVSARLGPLRKARLHAALGLALEAQHPSAPDEVVPDLARHFTAAAGVGEADRACSYSLRASDVALRTHTHDVAERHVRHALEAVGLLPPGARRDELELRAQAQLAHVLAKARGYQSRRVGAAAARASELAGGELRDAPVDVCWRLAMFHLVSGHHDEAAAVARELVAAPSDQLSHRLLGHLVVGLLGFPSGRLAEAAESLAEASRLALLVSDPVLEAGMGSPAYALVDYSLAHVRWLRGDGAGAWEVSHALLARARTDGDTQGLAFALQCRAVLLTHEERYAEALETAEETMPLADRHGLVMHAAVARGIAGAAQVALGRADGVELAVEGLLAQRAMGVPILAPMALGALARALLQHGQVARARDVVDEALVEVAALHQTYYQPELLRLRALCDPTGPQARQDLEDALAIAESHGSAPFVAAVRETLLCLA